MGLAYTIDSPIKVARFGISSVISLMDDRLLEMMRRYYCHQLNLEYIPISAREADYRAKRITDYLNLVHRIVNEQMAKLKTEAFVVHSELQKYFEMLPEMSELKKLYIKWLNLEEGEVKESIERQLRNSLKAGQIDVNIMTKPDRNNLDKDGVIIPDGSDGVTALRGFVKSNLKYASVIFSAGMNPRLYNYLEQCEGFDQLEDGEFTRKVVIKVSDYRSAFIQGKYLAKKGIWVSEFRIESGLNCGGHAFATEGYLMGPILEEFKNNLPGLVDTLFDLFQEAWIKKGHEPLTIAPALRLTVQGGIGTAAEDQFLHTHYPISSTGWGSPFLLVPEATTVDRDTLSLLSLAKEEDIVLSRNSPLGVRFYNIKGTTSGIAKELRIREGKPGTPCTDKLLAYNTEFTTEPICTASRKYQKLKIEQLQSLNLSEADYQQQVTDVLAKECLCVGLSNAAAISYNETFIKNRHEVTICPGPNMVNFSRVVSLQEMTDHIYGRTNIMSNPDRPHVFIAEIRLYIQYLNEQLIESNTEDPKQQKYLKGFFSNLMDGISYYRNHVELIRASNPNFESDLDTAEVELKGMHEMFEDQILQMEVCPH